VVESTFWSDVDRLTTANHKIIHRDKGTEVLTSTGMIQQLRDAVQQGAEGLGGSASFGSRPPIDPAAQDLLREIGGQARMALQTATGLRPPVGSAERHLRLWAAAVNESTMVTVMVRRQVPDRVVDAWYRADPNTTNRAVFKEPLQMEAWRLVKHWISRIDGFFYPPDTREIKAPCPSCEERWIYREKDGQTVQMPAMVFVRVEGEVTEARCLACGLRWAPSQFEWLARAVGAAPLPELIDTPETAG
jgi:hypothetical protein